MTNPHFVPGLSLSREDIDRRRLSIGASDMPAVLGMSKYKSALQLWAEKTGRVDPTFEGNEFTEWGTRLEGVVADAYAQKVGVIVMAVGTIVIPEGWRSATPDRKVMTRDQLDASAPGAPTLDSPWLRGLEVKCRGDYSATDFGEPGSDQIPDDVAIQCHTNMSVLRVRGVIVDEWDVATLIGGNRFRWYRVFYDAQIDADLTEAAYNFWHRYVVPNIEPPVDGSLATQEYLRQKFPTHTETMIRATPEHDQMLAELRDVRLAKKDLEAEEEGIKNRLMTVIGENAGIEGNSGKVHWKTPNGVTVAWKDVAEAMGAPKELIAQHSTPLSRRFSPYFPKKK